MADSSLSVQDAGGVRTVSFRANSILDAVTIDRIANELYALVEPPEARWIVLDFKGVAYLASRALGVLATLRKKAEAAHSIVVLSQIHPQLRELFKLTNMHKLYKCFDRTQEAIDFFHKSNLKSVLSGVGETGRRRR